MDKDLAFPRTEAVASVLRKIGIDPDTRIGWGDEAYTACEMGEMERYLDLYFLPDTDKYEKRVLGCFLLQSLNDYHCSMDRPHTFQNLIFALLCMDETIHASEITYWSDLSDPDGTAWWTIARELDTWQQTHGMDPSDEIRPILDANSALFQDKHGRMAISYLDNGEWELAVLGIVPTLLTQTPEGVDWKQMKLLCQLGSLDRELSKQEWNTLCWRATNG